MLCDDIASFYADPMGFVMYAYPWDTNESIQMVELVEPWASRYNCKYGPDEWACKFLDDLGEQIRNNDFDGRHAVEPIRESIKSGHGIGKSAMTGWLTNFIMSTRPHSQGTVTANTGPQLETKTWAQIAKWTKLCATGHWFDVSTGRGSMKMVHKQNPESWFCSAQTCREENSEAFAGQHAVNATSFYIFDESSAVPDKIDEVSEGGMTDGEPMKFKFGNPTRNSGHFFNSFNKDRHRYGNTTVDSRDVQITNKKELQKWIDDHGIESDFVKMRVLGLFPDASSHQLIPTELARTAQQRVVGDQAYMPILIGVDVARFGDDQSVIRIRRGRDAKNFHSYKYRGLDTMQLAAKVVEVINGFPRGAIGGVFIDGGGVGGGGVDRVRQMGYKVMEVNFAGKSSDPRYANKRAQMYGRLKEWLEIGAIDDDQDMFTDLISIEYGYSRTSNAILLESKEDMKKRGLVSPDDSDALAVTFAEDIGPLPTRQGQNVGIQHEYDPYARP